MAVRAEALLQLLGEFRNLRLRPLQRFDLVAEHRFRRGGNPLFEPFEAFPGDLFRSLGLRHEAALDQLRNGVHRRFDFGVARLADGVVELL